jgi:hypothetical protein
VLCPNSVDYDSNQTVGATVPGRLSQRGTKNRSGRLIRCCDTNLDPGGTCPHRGRTDTVDRENRERNGTNRTDHSSRRETVQQWHFPETCKARSSAWSPLAYEAG